MNLAVLKAIFKRDFVSYFSNPTGYVFICVFVMLSSLAAFWPPEFFSNNLANLDQLSRWMPFILVVFIPAITMSVWAEERRQGTDELLLTLPASDVDVVLGKYKACVAIFTVALLFSMFSIYLVFSWGLGSPDLGLFACTYLGYWFVGIAMLAVGMVASFLTSNLTVGFILGMLFNAPAALLGVADWVIKDPGWADTVRGWGVFEQFADFSRGVISLSSLAYFVLIAAAMLYICLILIGRRHWSGGDDGQSMGGHYFARAIAIFVLALGINGWLSNSVALRADLTSEQINSLSPKTVELIRELGTNDEIAPIKVDAYVSPQVPAEYAAQKSELLSTLEELRSISKGKIQVNRREVETFSEEASLAERTYGIEPRAVDTKSRGTRTRQEIFMGVAFTSGLDKVVIPFLDKGIPVEYELLRSITTVAQQKRKRVGVLKTDVQLNGGFTMQGATPESQLIVELKKQYDVTEVDPATPITETFDVLVAVQPSSLSPEAMDNFVEAVKQGQPTAIFEDPFPLPSFYPNVPGTAQPKQPGGGMMGMFGGGQPPQPKGDITQLWNLIGARIRGTDVIWQDYNPYVSAANFVSADWIFVDRDNGAVEPFNPDSPIVSDMSQTLFLYAGGIDKLSKGKTSFTPLASTGKRTGTISIDSLRQAAGGGDLMQNRLRTTEAYVLAAAIEGTVNLIEDTQLDESVDAEDLLAEQEAQKTNENDESEADAKAEEQSEVKVVLIADIDCLADPFFAIRAIGSDQDAIVDWRFQNVALVLNILDYLAGDDRFLDVRKRTREYRTLTKIEDATEEYREAALKERSKFVTEASRQIEAVRQNFREKIGEIENRDDLKSMVKRQMVERERIRSGRKRDVNIAALEKDRDRQIRQSELDLAAKVRGVQNWYKFCAVVLPPILPILLALLVYLHRRQSEQEGVSQSRLRYGGPAKTAEPAA